MSETTVNETQYESDWVKPHENIGTEYEGIVTKRFSFTTAFGTTEALALEDVNDPTKEIVWSLGHKNARDQARDLMAGDHIKFSCVRKNSVTDERSRVPKYVYDVKVIK